jgi:hypothetical protein
MTRPFTHIAAILLLIVAAAHAYRLFAHLDVVIGGYAVPLWISWLGLAVPGLLAVMLFAESRR